MYLGYHRRFVKSLELVDVKCIDARFLVPSGDAAWATILRSLTVPDCVSATSLVQQRGPKWTNHPYESRTSAQI